MRQIKFRGRRKDNSEWVYGYYVNDPEGWAYIIEFDYDDYIKENQERHHEVDPETVGQYIGLTLKDRDVYDGDAYYYRDGSDSCHLVVRWDDDRLAWDYIRVEDGVFMHGYNGWGLLEDSEYIGTVHDNPEPL